VAATLAFAAAGCGGSSNKSAGGGGTTSTSANNCDKGSLNLVDAGQLTVGTDNPAYPPWFGGNEKAPWKVSDPRSGQGFESAVAAPWKVSDPRSGQGFESAVAYAV